MDYIPFLKNIDLDAIWMRYNEMVKIQNTK